MVIYTAIFGNYDVLRPPHPDSNCPHVCFTDGDYECEGWTVIKVKPRYGYPCLDARRCKIIGPWELLPKADISLWIDGAMEMKVPPDTALAESLLGEADLARFHHRQRKCAGEEADACIEFEKDRPDIIRSQVKGYFTMGFPKNYGLSLTGFLLRRRNDECEEFCRMWWNQVRSGSWRDQLSIDYCRWRTGLKCSWVPGTICNNQFVKHYPKHPKP